MKRFGLALIVLTTLFIAASHAFPLQTSDGEIVIYGMIPTEKGFALDIYTKEFFYPFSLSVAVVDSEDRFISGSTADAYRLGDLHRALYFFELDEPATQIKRIRIETPETPNLPISRLYSIPWSGVPEVSNKNITIRLYKITDNSVEGIEGLRFKKYDLEVRVTNNMPYELELSSNDFKLTDQFNYEYGIYAEKYKLLPNESVRYVLHSQGMSPLSRPKALVYLPENLTMDLEEWC